MFTVSQESGPSESFRDGEGVTEAFVVISPNLLMPLRDRLPFASVSTTVLIALTHESGQKNAFAQALWQRPLGESFCGPQGWRGGYDDTIMSHYFLRDLPLASQTSIGVNFPVTPTAM